MDEKSQEKQPAVRPQLLIVLLIALGATLYWNFTQPKPAPITPPPSATAVTPMTSNVQAGFQLETGGQKNIMGPISKRDLFLPPASIIAARRRKVHEVNQPARPVWNEPSLIKPVKEITSVKPDENSEKPVLKGIVGTASSQVIIIRYHNKSYILKLGEILPGTDYRLVEISDGTAVLLSPKGRLKLDRKERDK